MSAGIAVPLFSQAQRARVAAWDIQVQIRQNDLDWSQKQVVAARDLARREILKYRESVLFYENEMLPNAESMIRVANAQFAAGEIDYLQWTLLIGQSLYVQQQFATEKYNFNRAVLRFQQFSNL